MQWFTSYLESRSQKVCIQKSLSKSINIISGVPQGSILGPLFFILYINDIPLFLSNTEEVIYADDLTLTTMCNDIKDVESNFRIDTGKSFDWCKQNDMVLSLPKCCSMLVASRQKLLKIDSKIDIDIDDTVIPSVSTTKILGVILMMFYHGMHTFKMCTTKLIKIFTYYNRLNSFSLLVPENCFSTAIYCHILTTVV